MVPQVDGLDNEETVAPDDLTPSVVESVTDAPESTTRESGPGRRRRFIGRAKVCLFCTDSTAKINYKEHDLLRRFLTDRAKIRPRRQTGTCAKHQRALAQAIKRARHLALLPFTGEHIRQA
jgi:small subunit ribosomal protein S18